MLKRKLMKNLRMWVRYYLICFIVSGVLLCTSAFLDSTTETIKWGVLTLVSWMGVMNTENQLFKLL